MKKLLALDMSTKCTGWATFNLDTGELLEYGLIKPKVPGISKLKYPMKALYNMLDMAQKLAELVDEHQPEKIVIEEVNRGINRIAQKSLDALHFVFLERLVEGYPEGLEKLLYVDSNGLNGWRGKLGLRLSKEDKAINKKIRANNKKQKKNDAVINWKTLSVRYVNEHFKVGLRTDNDPKTDGDIGDAICIGYSYFI